MFAIGVKKNMLRYQRFLALVLPALSAYCYFVLLPLGSHFPMAIANALLNLVPGVGGWTPLSRGELIRILSPLLAVAMLGVYAVSDIAYTVITFNDCKDAAAEIETQVKEAKKEMKRRKIE
ncbi:hypothetical protein TrLO_g10671 [Triparma laevis f. longispina]|uniref:Dolichol-phosphate mannosyltransferase subunit 3 n=1 Tax=Triparma laevis f. longispina TaxID=1714387 RepID=A0A9W6ZZ37_9STRA|nr:hypothetical protein TrLO_g10671 [Triparma laevis f. longispina]